MDSRREKIIQTASRLFSEKGVAETTLSQIARAVGMAQGTLYYYYPAKEALVLEVLDRSIGQMVEGVGEVPMDADLGTLFREVLQVMYDNPDLNRSFAHVLRALLRDPEFREKFAEGTLRQWRSNWEELFRSRGLAKPEHLAVIFSGLLAGLFLEWYAQPDAVDPAQLGPVIAQLFQGEFPRVGRE